MQRRFTGVTLIVLGAILLILELGSTPLDSTMGLIRTGPFLLIAGAVSFVGAWLVRDDEPLVAYGPQILIWTFGSATTFAAIGYLITLGHPVDSITGGLPVPVLDAFTAGSLAGILVGVYDARSRLRFDSLQVERDRVERFARKAKSLNAYGKALNESRDIHDVSALSIEVLELLIGSTESAVVGVSEETQVLDSTVHGDRREFVGTLAGEVATGPVMETVRCPSELDCSLPGDLAGAEVIGIPITGGDATIVLLSVIRDGQGYTAEDLDLLESLSAHVGTALRNLDRNTVSAGS